MGTLETENTTPRRALRETIPRRGDKREAALFAVAEQLLEDERFDEASITEIALEARISRATFYHYFASKQALLHSLLTRTMDDLILELSKRFDDPGATPSEAMRGVLEAVADVWFEHRAAMMAVVATSAREPVMFDHMTRANRVLTEAALKHLVLGRNVSTEEEAAELSRLLSWMTERNLYVVAREDPTRSMLHEAAERLYGIWIRAVGLDEPAPSVSRRGRQAP